MRRIIFSLWFAVALSTEAAEQLFADIGDLHLTSGDVIENCRVGYRTYGNLNADKSNVLIFPTWFTGRTESLEEAALVGPGRLADSEKYFVITFDALGNGVSTSPSNYGNFPRISTYDMVRSQYKVLTEHLDINHVAVVMGISMGGMQTFSWLARYPGFMDKAVPIDGSPQMTSFDLLQWQTHKDLIRTLQAAEFDDQEILSLVNRVSLLSLFTPEYFVERVSREDLPGFIEQSAREYEGMTADDYVSQLEAMIDHDLLGPDERSAKEYIDSIDTEVLIIGVPSDHMVNQQPAKELAPKIGAEYFEVESECGHVGSSCEGASVLRRVASFLAE